MKLRVEPRDLLSLVSQQVGQLRDKYRGTKTQARRIDRWREVQRKLRLAVEEDEREYEAARREAERNHAENPKEIPF